MEEIMKSYLSFFLLFFMVAIGLGMVSISLENRNAANQLDNFVRQIEAAHMAETVIQRCEQEASDRGYELQYFPVETEADLAYGTLKMRYQYGIPLIGLLCHKELERDVN